MQLSVVRIGKKEFIRVESPQVEMTRLRQSGLIRDRHNGRDYAIVRTITDPTGEFERTHQNPWRVDLHPTVTVCWFRVDVHGIRLIRKKRYIPQDGQLHADHLSIRTQDLSGWELDGELTSHIWAAVSRI